MPTNSNMPKPPPYTFGSRSLTKEAQSNGTFENIGSTTRQDEDGISSKLCFQQENQLLERENLAFRKYVLLMVENSDLRAMNVYANLMCMCDKKLQGFISEKCSIHAASDTGMQSISSDNDKNGSSPSCDNSLKHILPSSLNEQSSNNTKNYRHRTLSESQDKTSSHLHGNRNRNDLYTAADRNSSVDESQREVIMPTSAHFSDSDDIKNGEVSQSLSCRNRTLGCVHLTDNQTCFSPIQECFTVKASPKETLQHTSVAFNKTKHGYHECMNLVKGLPNGFQNHASVKIRGVFDKKSQASCPYPVSPSDGDMKKLHINSNRFHKYNPAFTSTTTKGVLQSSQILPKTIGFPQYCEQCGGKFIGSESREDHVGAGYCQHQDCRFPVNSMDEGCLSNTNEVHRSLHSESGYNGSAKSQEGLRTFPKVQNQGQYESDKTILSHDNQSTNRDSKGISSLSDTTVPRNTSRFRCVISRSKEIDKSGSNTSSKTRKEDAVESSYAPRRHSCTESHYRAQLSDFGQTVANVGASSGDQTLQNHKVQSVLRKPTPNDPQKNTNGEEMLGNPAALHKPMRAAMKANSMNSEGDDEQLNESLVDMMATECSNLPVREQKALFVFHRPVDTLTGYQPKVTAVLKSVTAHQHQNKRLVGEIAFQLDRRILDFVFRDLCEKNRRKRCPRYYGYSIVNISQLIAKEARLNYDEPRLDIMLHDKLIQVIQLLSHFGYNFEKHAEFTQEIVNSYGLLGDDILENDEGSALNQPAALRIILGKILKDDDELYNMLIILDCLCYLAFHDKRPLFL